MYIPQEEIVLVGALILLGMPGIALIINAATQTGKSNWVQAALSLTGGAILLSAAAMIVYFGFMKARESAIRNACISNLRQIDGAKDTYALEYGRAKGDSIPWAAVAMYVKDITNKCYCSAMPGNQRFFESNYVMELLGTDPACSNFAGTASQPNHSLRFKS